MSGQIKQGATCCLHLLAHQDSHSWSFKTSPEHSCHPLPLSLNESIGPDDWHYLVLVKSQEMETEAVAQWSSTYLTCTRLWVHPQYYIHKGSPQGDSKFKISSPRVLGGWPIPTALLFGYFLSAFSVPCRECDHHRCFWRNLKPCASGGTQDSSVFNPSL